MPTPAELVALLAFPNESLTIEYKSWLPLSENPGRATLAKAAIALANHGGGIIVLGMRPNNAEGGALHSEPRPPALRRYSQDDINAAINRYAEPSFHCELLFSIHPGTGIEHAFVSVPGGISVPVMSTRDCPGIIAAQRCYVRKPGPRSEEPFTAEEWRSVIGRCVRAGREDMLDAIRLIVQGHAPGPLAAEARNMLAEFVESSRQRWRGLIAPLPTDDVATMPHGYYELSFEINGVAPAPNLVELRQRMETARAIRHTGWGPFVNLHRAGLEPRAVDGMIEAWLGLPDADRLMRTPAHCDFWRVDRSGKRFLIRGYDEDEVEQVPAGTAIDVTLPIWRVGEAMLYVARLANTFGENPSILVQYRYTGLRNRALRSLTGHRFMFGDRVCSDDEVTIETQANADTISDNLAEVLHPFIVPLYERFSFFELSMTTVVDEIERMTRHRF